MTNGIERAEGLAAAARLLRQLVRITVSFASVSLAYLVSGVPYRATSHGIDGPAVPADARGTLPRATAPAPPQAVRGRVVADSFWSPALGIRKRFVVYLPPSYETSPTRRYPVAYYLHGMAGDEWNWVRAGSLDRTLDSLIARGVPEMIVIMPDGDDGWYTTWNNLGNNAECRRGTPPRRRGETVDEYCVPWPKYDDYIARDLVARVDSVYRTVAARAARGIAGLSMGGYGAISLALAYPDVYSAAASHSGVLSPLYSGPHPRTGAARYAANESELRANAGALWPEMRLVFGRDTMGWWARDPGRRAARYGKDERRPMPALMFDVGVDDRYADLSRDFRATLQRLGVAHTYAEWPGGHDWNYWRRHASESVRWLAVRLESASRP